MKNSVDIATHNLKDTWDLGEEDFKGAAGDAESTQENILYGI